MFTFPARTESQTAPAPPTAKLHWYQFRLRTLLFGVFLVSLGMSWFAVRMQRAREQEAAARELNKFEDAFIYYDCVVENRLGFGPEENNTPRGPAWLRGLLGDDFFNDVTRVNLSGTETDDDLKRLRAFPKLRHLLLQGTHVSDDGLKHLESLTCLELLELCHLKITDDGLVHLRSLTGLHYLGLGGTPISDAGITHLKRMHQLREISLWNTRVTDAGVRELQAALPHCEITR
jgi:hypothetical protein